MIRPKTIERETLATVFDRGKERRVIVNVDPVSATVGFRLKSTRREYRLPAQWLYIEAVTRNVAAESQQKVKRRKR